MRNRQYVAAVLGLFLWTLPAETVAQDPEIRPPLPVIKRVKPLSEASVFERPRSFLQRVSSHDPKCGEKRTSAACLSNSQ